MKNDFLILTLIFALFGVSLASFASEVEPAMTVGVKETPSESFLSTNKRSIGASTDYQAMSAESRGLNKASADFYGWSNSFLPGEDGWEISEPGNVGYPIGDVSLPILLSMILIYFAYRGVSSSKRRSNF